MRKNKTQVLKDSIYTYQVVLTMPKFKNNKEVTCNWDFQHFEDAWEKFKAEVFQSSEHLTIVPTSRIIGLYRNGECKQQIVIQAYEKPYSKS